MSATFRGFTEVCTTIHVGVEIMWANAKWFYMLLYSVVLITLSPLGISCEFNGIPFESALTFGQSVEKNKVCTYFVFGVKCVACEVVIVAVMGLFCLLVRKHGIELQ